jgi:dCMP deaminase
MDLSLKLHGLATIQVEGCSRAIHAEANVIAYAARHGVMTEGTVMYSTAEPCQKCAELIVQAGILAVHYENPYRLGASEFLDKNHVIIKQHAWTPSG